VGEIGINRHVFYKELKWWEVKAIIRGYNARQHPGWEQTRWIAYHVRFCMGLPKGEVAPVLTEWIKFPWEKETVIPITEDERAELVAEMNAWNEMFAKE
jgi:hypothetical protein